MRLFLIITLCLLFCGCGYFAPEYKLEYDEVNQMYRIMEKVSFDPLFIYWYRSIYISPNINFTKKLFERKCEELLYKHDIENAWQKINECKN